MPYKLLKPSRSPSSLSIVTVVLIALTINPSLLIAMVLSFGIPAIPIGLPLKLDSIFGVNSSGEFKYEDLLFTSVRFRCESIIAFTFLLLIIGIGAASKFLSLLNSN